jgi:hypothetical protein
MKETEIKSIRGLPKDEKINKAIDQMFGTAY